MKNLLLIVMVGLLAVGCTRRIGQYSIISTKNIEMSKAATFTRGTTRVEGADIKMMVLGIPMGISEINNAVDKAIESVPGCIALTDGVVEQQMFYLFLFGSLGYQVKGTPLIDPALIPKK